MNKLLGRFADFVRETDKILLSLCIFASMFGCVLVMSATRYTGSYKQFFVQLGALGLGLVLVIFISGFIEYGTIVKVWPVIAGVALLLVGLTFVIGYAPPGTDDKAWLLLPGGISFQPAELLKIAFVITFAKHVSMLDSENISFLNVILLCIHGAIPVLLIHIQGDDGSALVLAVIFICMFFAAGVKLRYFAIAGGALLCLSPVLWFVVMNDDQRQRITILFNPEMDLLGSGWQQWRARIALANGGFFGSGLFRGQYVQAGAVPEGYNDFIFASAGEELGMLGLICIIALLAAICIRIIMVAHQSKDRMGMIICVGIFAMIAIQSILNIGMCVSILPVIGITLPFFSAGGSSLVTLMIGIGLVLNVYMHRNKKIVYLNEA